MIKLAHIINPVNAPEASELHRLQPVTFESIHKAKSFAQKKIDVKVYAIGYEEDRSVMPDFCHILDNLERSVQDLSAFTKKRKLPLIGDILRSLYENTDSEWLIYTNVDICLMPQFYDAVASMIAQGNDAILITRRRV